MQRCLLFVLFFSTLAVVSLRAQETAEPPKIHIVPDSAVTAEQRVLIEQAIPTDAVVKLKKPRKLLIFDINADYGGHRAIAYANLAFTLMGKKTGAFETTISQDPQVFQAESLKQFDAVFFKALT